MYFCYPIWSFCGCSSLCLPLETHRLLHRVQSRGTRTHRRWRPHGTMPVAVVELVASIKSPGFSGSFFHPEMDGSSSSNAPRLGDGSPQNNQVSASLSALGIWLSISTLCWLLQFSYFYAMHEECSNMVWVEKMNCQLHFQSFATPVWYFVLLMVQANGKIREDRHFSIEEFTMLLSPMNSQLSLGCIHHAITTDSVFHFLLVNLGIHVFVWRGSNQAQAEQKIDSSEQVYPNRYQCTRFSLTDGALVEDAVLVLFGLNHRRWMTTLLLLILRFNSGDTLSLSSMMVLRYLQLNTPQPQVHTPDRPSGEPPAGHQLVWSMEAFGDYNCGIVESELSTDDRAPFGSTCSLLRLLQELSSSFSLFVQLSSLVPCSDLKSHVLMYCDP